MNTPARLLAVWLRAPCWLRWLAPLAGMAVLWWSSSRTPSSEVSSVLRGLLHNSMHVVAYAGLAMAFWAAMARTPVEPRAAARSWGAWCAAVAYGGIDELHQSYVPGRVMSAVDLLTDTLGAAFGVAVFEALANRSAGAWRAAVMCLVAGCGSAALATFGDF